MTDDALVITERLDNGIALVRLNRPPLNPLSCALLDAISDAAEAARRRRHGQGGRGDRQRPRVRGRVPTSASSPIPTRRSASAPRSAAPSTRCPRSRVQ